MTTTKPSRATPSRAAKRRLDVLLVERGLLCMTTSPHVRLQPALTLDADTARTAAGLLREGLATMAAADWWRHA